MEEQEKRRPQQPSLEKRLLRGEVVYSGQKTLKEFVDHDGEDAVGLLETPFNFQVWDLGDSHLYAASFPKSSSLYCRGLMKVLSGALPIGRRIESKGTVYFHWSSIFGKSEREVNEFNQNTYHQHMNADSPIAEAISDFELNHHPLFSKVINSRVLFGDTLSDDLENQVTSLVSVQKAELIYGIDFFKQNPEGFIQSVRDAFSGGKEQDKKTIDRAINTLYSKSLTTEEMIVDFHNQSSEEEKVKLTLGAVNLFSPHGFDTVLVDLDSENVNSHWAAIPGIKRAEDNALEIRHWESTESYVRVAFVQDEETGFKEPKIVEINVPSEKGIVPAIIWERNKKTRKSQYYCGKISQELISAFPHLFSDNHDTLAGQLVVADYSKDVRDKLPRELPLKEGGKPFPVAETQIGVVVKMYEQEFLQKSPVILGLERSITRASLAVAEQA